jgi:hypothetical protein
MTMYRSPVSVLALVLGLAACSPHGQPNAGSKMLDHHPVASGESNRFFVANTARSFTTAADVRLTPVKDSAGHQAGFRLATADNKVATVTCDCPASCSATRHRPVSSVQWTLGDTEESQHAGGSCGSPDGACAMCGLVYWNGDATSIVKEPVGVAVAEAN